MAINFNCEGCGRAMQVKDHLAGKTGKCPDCGSSVKVPDGENNLLDMDFSQYDQPSIADQSLNKPCPMCGEMISGKSSTCPACGESLEEMPAKKKKQRRSISGDTSEESKVALQIFLTGIIGCFSPIVAIYGMVFLLRNQHDFPRKPLAIIGTLLHCFWVVVLIYSVSQNVK